MAGDIFREAGKDVDARMLDAAADSETRHPLREFLLRLRRDRANAAKPASLSKPAALGSGDTNPTDVTTVRSLGHFVVQGALTELAAKDTPRNPTTTQDTEEFWLDIGRPAEHKPFFADIKPLETGKGE